MRKKTLFILLTLFGVFFLNHSYADAETDIKFTPEPNFDNVLLIVNFNHPYYNNIDFLKEIYAPVFPNIVFYGEKKHPEVNCIKHHFGYWSQNVIQDAMECWPNFEGYLCVQDDCFMNYWNYIRFNKEKVWFSPNVSTSLTHKKLTWPWWNQPFGRAAIIKSIEQLPPKNKKILENNLGVFCACFTWSDFAYIPGRLREDYIEVCQCFLDPLVFVELAIPTILCAIEPRNNWEIVKPLWGVDAALKNYKTDYDWVHPIKFSDPQNRNFIRNVIANYGYFPQKKMEISH